MYKTDKMIKNKICASSVNLKPRIKYHRKIPKNSKVFIKNNSHEKYKLDNTSNEFRTIMRQMYSEINKDPAIKEDNDNIYNYISPKRNIGYSINLIKERNVEKKRLFPSHSSNLFNCEKPIDRLSIKRIKLYENEDLYSPYHDYNNQLMDRFTQISIIRPNKNDVNLEQSSDVEVPNEDYVYFYEPNKDLKLEKGNSSKGELENNFNDYKLIFKNEISFSVVGIDKKKDELKYNEWVQNEEKYNNLLIKYNELIKELDELKGKNIFSSDSRIEEKIIQHLDDVIIVQTFNNTKGRIKKRKRQKIKKVKNKRVNSLTPNKTNYSSSEETKTRDNSINAIYSSNKQNELNKNKKIIPKIMIISKENEFNLTASSTQLITNNNSISNKPKKKIKKIIKKNSKKDIKKEKKNEENIDKESNIKDNNKEDKEKDNKNDNNKDNEKFTNYGDNPNNWNKLNKILNNISINYIGNSNKSKIENESKDNLDNKISKDNKKKLKNKDDKKPKKRVLKPKARNIKTRGISINNTHKKIRKIDLPSIDIKNEITLYDIKKNYIRFKSESKTIDCKISKNDDDNIKKNLNNTEYIRFHNESLSIGKNAKSAKKEGIIVKNINLNVINIKEKKNEVKNSKNKEIKDEQILELNSENRELSFYSNEIKENSVYLSEDEKNMIRRDEIDNYNKKKNNEISYIKDNKKGKKYPVKTKIIKYSNKNKKDNKYIDILIKNLVDRLLTKRKFKKWVKLTKNKIIAD